MTSVSTRGRPNREPATRYPSRFRALFRFLWLVVILPVPLLALDPAKSIFQFNLQSWTRQDGLPSDKTNTVVQTSDGYIWLGTQRGLVRYDGSEFKEIIPAFPGAGGTEAAALAASHSGALRLAIAQGGYGTFTGRAFSELDAKDWPGEPRGGRTIFEARDGTVWVGAVGGVGRWVPGRPQENFWNDTPTNVQTFCEDRAGRIWIGTEDRGAFCFDHGTLSHLADSSLQNEVIRALAPGANGELWVGTGRGLRGYDAQGRRIKLATIEEMAGSIAALLLDSHGTLWIGISGRGLARYRDGVFTVLRKSDGLGSDYVTSLCEDAEGSLWVGTRDGLSELTEVRFPIYSEPEGLSVGTGHTVSASRNGGVWLTTSTGYSYFDGRNGHRAEDAGLPANRYIKIGFEARNGDFYIVDGDRTVSVCSGGRIVASFRNEYWPEAITEDAESVIVGIGERLFRIRDGRMEPYAFRDGKMPPMGYILNLTVSKDNAIWVATPGGIFRVKDGEFRQWSVAEGLSGPRVHFLFEDTDGSIWAGLPTGLARLRDNVIRNITTVNGLPADRVYAIVPDNQGFFWMSTSRGIVRAPRQGLNAVADGTAARVACDVFEGLESTKFSDRTEQGNSGCRTADGRIWFPNPKGMVMIDPANYYRNRVPPPVHVQSIRVDGRELPDLHAPMLEAGADRVEILFTALSFTAAKKMQIRYRLEGFDATWIDAGARRSVLYSNLPPGRYTFRVQACNADGLWNAAGDSVPFELPPRFYQTAWFYAAVAGTIVLGLLGMHRWRVRLLEAQRRKLQAENDLLEAKVSKRTDELANLVSLLKATIESTADGIVALHSSGKIISFNSQFASMWGFQPEQLAQDGETNVIGGTAAQVNDPEKFLARIHEVLAHPEIDAYDVLELKDGRTIERYCKPQRVDGQCVGIVVNFRDVTARKQAEAKLDQVNKQLVEASREAGMAEIATNVLHNVGNVLNSVNVSAALVMEHVRQSRAAKLPKLAAVLQEHDGHLGDFLAHDPKGRKIPEYLNGLAHEIEAQEKTIIDELVNLRRNVEHINEIVAMQQSYARRSGVTENVSACELVEDALRINSGAIGPDGHDVVREYSAHPAVAVDRHKVVQILVNLIMNAKLACDETGRPDKQVKLRVSQDERHASISVIDNGVGIAPANLTRIFEHGFTTRKRGHGFGLHSAALAARELGGSVTATSDGLGKGATFTLELPLRS